MRSPSDILRSVEQIAFLPPAFELIPRLLVLLQDPEGNSESLADAIRLDAGLTADVLHISNTVFFASNRRIETLQEAIMRLGLREIYQIVTKVIASPLLGDSGQTGFQRFDLWRHSLACAVAAKILANDTGASDPEVAFTAGLLHDVGKVVLTHALGAEYIKLADETRAANAAFFEAEKRVLKVTHPDVGARLLQRWKFPESIVSAVEFHHAPTAPSNRQKGLAALIYLANVLAHRAIPQNTCPEYVALPQPAFLRLINVSPDALDRYQAEITEALEREEAPFR
ncbi:MAG TPA: HDOD domain-containing protein [Verrucomicrobiae bacterium]|jgi:putative nucleotidyltransferase with HDIG domain|nr:HDOD domain-containing protein [Verrucomicrobiae bacterium]